MTVSTDRDDTGERPWRTGGPQPGGRCAQIAVAWINRHGGEARYGPHYRPFPAHQTRTEPRIAIRNRDGEVHAAPGDTIVMGEKWFSVQNYPEPCLEFTRFREFTVRRAS